MDIKLKYPVGIVSESRDFLTACSCLGSLQTWLKNDIESGLLSEIIIVDLDGRVFKVKNFTNEKYDHWLPLFLIPRDQRLVTVDLEFTEGARLTLEEFKDIVKRVAQKTDFFGKVNLDKYMGTLETMYEVIEELCIDD